LLATSQFYYTSTTTKQKALFVVTFNFKSPADVVVFTISLQCKDLYSEM